MHNPAEPTRPAPSGPAPSPSPLPAARYLTDDIPGIGGVIKQRPEDFLVEEIPLYEPSGEGEHLYLLVEKRAMSTFEAMGVLAHHFGVRHDSIGYAGLKDKKALTRQVFSIHVPGKRPEDFPMLQHDQMAVLWVDMHANKLRQGHLKGNRFSIKVRSTEMSRAIAARRILDRLVRHGVPNYFGEQRFGHLLNNHLVGRALIRRDFRAVLDILLGPTPYHTDTQAQARERYVAGDYAGALAAFTRSLHTERTMLRLLAKGVEPEHAVRAAGTRALSFFVSSWQSEIFNRVLDARVADGTFGSLLVGDLAFHHASRNTFHVTPEVLAQEDTAPRLASFEISPSGPMWGVRMRRAEGEIDRREVETLEATGVTLAELEAFDRTSRDLIEGARRPLRVSISDIDVEGGIDEHGHYVRCAFDLPRGAFATMVMREVIKPATRDAALLDDE